MSSPRRLRLFEAFGIELEYMIVDSESLDVRPVADELLRSVLGVYVADYENGPIAWSNELALHVVELKTNGPAEALCPLPSLFADNVGSINTLLEPLGCRLLPTAMHPWMEPDREFKLWPHDDSPIYEAYNRIFDCRGHGWANLQSMHINLPFADDAEFARLHAAIRLALPLLPALAASSPIIDGRATGLLDNRMEVYRGNSRRVPSVAGRVIPEQAFSQEEYRQQIFRPMYAEIASLDPQGILQDEFLNSRGAIARFSRNTIEIRVLDVQECPAADLAVAELIVGLLKLLTAEHWTDAAAQQAVAIEPLEAVLLSAIRDADEAVVSDPDYLRHFGISNGPITIGDLWKHVFNDVETQLAPLNTQSRSCLDVILDNGPLARRILAALGLSRSRQQLSETYRRLADCLRDNRIFKGA
ncbi:MAG: glutamate--cysteine ligase [Planctomycetota bacterium]|nr:MAG: glutamate--cysteine ligase [Planctomycetota bacterium]